MFTQSRDRGIEAFEGPFLYLPMTEDQSIWKFDSLEDSPEGKKQAKPREFIKSLSSHLM